MLPKFFGLYNGVNLVVFFCNNCLYILNANSFLICNLETIHSKSTKDLSLAYYLPVVVVTNYYKLDGLKQQKIIFSWF